MPVDRVTFLKMVILTGGTSDTLSVCHRFKLEENIPTWMQHLALHKARGVHRVAGDSYTQPSQPQAPGCPAS